MDIAGDSKVASDYIEVESEDVPTTTAAAMLPAQTMSIQRLRREPRLSSLRGEMERGRSLAITRFWKSSDRAGILSTRRPIASRRSLSCSRFVVSFISL